MKEAKGGTDKWCPTCEEIRVVKVVDPSSWGEDRGQRWQHPQHPDLVWFRRGLICQTCGWEWTSAEIPESFVTELMALRNLVFKLRASAEAHVEAADQAANSLNDLRASLSDLDKVVTAGMINIKPRP